RLFHLDALGHLAVEQAHPLVEALQRSHAGIVALEDARRPQQLDEDPRQLILAGFASLRQGLHDEVVAVSIDVQRGQPGPFAVGGTPGTAGTAEAAEAVCSRFTAPWKTAPSSMTRRLATNVPRARAVGARCNESARTSPSNSPSISTAFAFTTALTQLAPPVRSLPARRSSPSKCPSTSRSCPDMVPVTLRSALSVDSRPPAASGVSATDPGMRMVPPSRRASAT